MFKLKIFMNICCIFFILICLTQNVGNNEAVNHNENNFEISQYLTSLIDNILPKNYNKNLRPNHGGRRTIVNISIIIDDIGAISETAMEYKIDFHICHSWNDYRLAYPVNHNITGVFMGEDWTDKIWIPDTVFHNSKEVNVHKTISSQSTTMFNIQSNGNVMYITWLSSVEKCPMDLTFFPLDQQKCSIDISSYGFKYGLAYHWADVAVQIFPDIYFPSFHLVGYSKHESISENILKLGRFTTLHCDLFLTRSIGYYVAQVYIPAFLVVVISWVPFWLDCRDNHHARVALGVTTVLTMLTLITNSRSDFPTISYLKAIDIYLFTSFVMVFLAFLEYAIVGNFDTAVAKCVNQIDTNEKASKTDDNSNNRSISNELEFAICKPKHTDISAIDRFARWLFPCCFLVFNIVYVAGLSVLISLVRRNQNIQMKL